MDINPVDVAKAATQTISNEPILDSPLDATPERPYKEDLGYGSRQMLDEVKSRNFGRQSTPETPQQSQQPESNREVQRLETELKDLRDKQEQSVLESSKRQETLFKDLLSRVSAPAPAQQPVQEEALPEIKVEDPDLAAALNALEQRQDIKRQREFRNAQQYLNNTHYSSQLANFRSAVRRMSDKDPGFKAAFSDEELLKYAQPYLTNAQFANVDWDHELGLARYSRLGPSIEQENAELKKKLEVYEKRGKTERAKQKENITMVPAMGQRGVGERTTNDRVGDFLNKARAKGQRVSFRDLGREIVSSKYGG